MSENDDERVEDDARDQVGWFCDQIKKGREVRAFPCDYPLASLADRLQCWGVTFDPATHCSRCGKERSGREFTNRFWVPIPYVWKCCKVSDSTMIRTVTKRYSASKETKRTTMSAMTALMRDAKGVGIIVWRVRRKVMMRAKSKPRVMIKSGMRWQRSSLMSQHTFETWHLHGLFIKVELIRGTV